MYTWLDFVNDFPNKFTGQYAILEKSSISWEDIKTLLSDQKFYCDWYHISRNPNITWEIIKDNLDNPKCKWDFTMISGNNMNQPFYKSKIYKKSLTKNITHAIFDELVQITCHPIRHPINYMNTHEVIDHPYSNLTQLELRNMA